MDDNNQQETSTRYSLSYICKFFLLNSLLSKPFLVLVKMGLLPKQWIYILQTSALTGVPFALFSDTKTADYI